jgi:hypothetical protein
MATVVRNLVRGAGPGCTVLLLGLLLLPAGCQRAAAPPLVRVVEVRVSDGTAADQPGAGAATEAELLEAGLAGLKKSGVAVELSKDGPAGREGQEKKEARPGDFRLRLEVRLEEIAPSPDTEGKGVMRALLRGRLLALGEHGPRVPENQGTGSGDQAGGDKPAPGPVITRFEQEAVAEKVYLGGATKVPRDAWAAHARRAVQDTACALGTQLGLLSAPREVLLKTLGRKDADPDLRGVAIQLAGLRKEKAAVPILVEMLKDPDGEVRDRAIGALIEIGDKSAVKPLAASATFQDTYELGKILEAVASLGGDEAKSYLSFVAAGHQNEIIRGEAKVALSHLEQREQREQEARTGKATEPRHISGDPSP